jgi:ABC-type spermidine/putrescine transport system permease subunit I
MGAGPLRSFYETDFKLTLPAAFAAAFIAFNWALAAFIGPVAMGNPGNYTIAVQVHAETLEHNNWPLGAALGTCNVLLAIAVLGTFMTLKRVMSTPRLKGGAE